MAEPCSRCGLSGMVSDGQVIVDRRVIWVSGIWDQVHQASLTSQPMLMPRMAMEQSMQRGPEAA
jgi:hypothetical protein